VETRTVQVNRDRIFYVIEVLNPVHLFDNPVEESLYSSFNLSARGDGWSTPRPGSFTPGKTPVSIVQEAE
jgi:hypothetical protein